MECKSGKRFLLSDMSMCLLKCFSFSFFVFFHSLLFPFRSIRCGCGIIFAWFLFEINGFIVTVSAMGFVLWQHNHGWCVWGCGRVNWWVGVWKLKFLFCYIVFFNLFQTIHSFIRSLIQLFSVIAIVCKVAVVIITNIVMPLSFRVVTVTFTLRWWVTFCKCRHF